MLNIHHLHLFYHVARHGGISAGTRGMPYAVQQPAVSAQIAALEAHLGLSLFDRRPFMLTAAGRLLYERITPFFSGLPLLEDELKADAAHHLRLASSTGVLRDYLPGMVRQLAQRIPALKLTLREAHRNDADRLLREREVDLAINSLTSTPPPGFEQEELIRLPLVLVVPTDSPWRTARQTLTQAPAKGVPLICLPPHEGACQIVQSEFQRRGHVWAPRIEVSSLDMVESYAGNGFGCGLTVQRPGVTFHDNVRAIPLTDFPPLIYGALWTGPLPAAAAAFLDLARQAAALLSTLSATPPRKTRGIFHLQQGKRDRRGERQRV
jgi:DNA-binding transcriptional LysR family regulator